MTRPVEKVTARARIERAVEREVTISFNTHCKLLKIELAKERGRVRRIVLRQAVLEQFNELGGEWIDRVHLLAALRKGAR
jgi:hypothetical protein